MRIGIIAPPWVPTPPPAYGGTETVVDTLARGLVQAGHDVRLFASGDSTSEVARDYVVPVAPGIDVGGSALEFHHIAHAYQLFADFDIVHDHTILGPLYASMRVEAPVVTTNHNPFSDPFATVLAAIGANVPIIAISEHHARSAGDIPIAAVIRHGVELSQFPLGKGEGGFALFLGRMTEDKGAHRAIRIAKAAGVRLVLAGKMHTDLEQQYFASEVAPLLSSSAEYVGEVDVPTKLELLSEAACLLNPIAWPEPFGMVMIEALACATPVLALASGAAPEIVEHGYNGFLGESEEDLVEGLRHLSEIDRSNCRASAEAKFSATRMVNEHVALYEKIIAERSRGKKPRRAAKGAHRETQSSRTAPPGPSDA